MREADTPQGVSVRCRMPAGYGMASLLLLVGLAVAVSGCASPREPASARRDVDPAYERHAAITDAAAIRDQAAAGEQDRMAAELKQKIEDLRRDEKRYRDKAKRARRDTGMSKQEREAIYQIYMSKAAQTRTQIDGYRSMLDTTQGAASAYRARTEDHLRRSRVFRSGGIPSAQSR